MSLLKHISLTFSAQIANSFLTFVASIYLTRILGVEGRGMYAIFINALAFAILFFGFSIQSSIIFLINTGRVELQRLQTTLLVFCFLSSLAVLLALIGLRTIGLGSLVLSDHYQTVNYILIFGAMYFASMINSIVATILAAFKRFKTQSFLVLVPTFLTLSVYVSAYYGWFGELRGSEFRFFLIVSLGTLLLTMVLSLATLAGGVRIAPSQPILKIGELKALFAFSSIAYAANLLQFLSYRLDFWFVDYYVGKGGVGIYSLATQLVQLLWLLPNAVGPVLYSHATTGSQSDGIRLTHDLLKKVCLVTAAGAIGLMVFFHFLLTPLYGDAFAVAVPVMGILLVGAIPFSAATVLAAYFASRGEYRINLLGAIGGFGVCLILYPILIKNYGLYGGAVASSLSYIVNTSILMYFAGKRGFVLRSMLPNLKSFYTVHHDN